MTSDPRERSTEVPARSANDVRGRILIGRMFFLLVGCICSRVDARTTPDTDRREFAARMARIAKGMAEVEAKAIVGEADDVWTEADNGPRNQRFGPKAVWRYGTN